MMIGTTRRSGRGRAHLGALVLALVGALLATPGGARAQVAVDELEMHFQLGRAGALTQVIPVRNEQDRVQQVRVVLNDWQRDTLGRNQFLPVGSYPGSCGDRLTVTPMTFRMEPKTEASVRVTVAPGADLAGCWGIVLFESVEPPRPNGEQGSFVSISVRTGVKVYVHAPNETRLGELTYGDVVQAWDVKELGAGKRDSSQVWQAQLRFQNTGTAHLKLKSTVELRDLNGTLLHRLAVPDAYVTPGALREIRHDLPALAKGGYVALLLVDFGGDEITAAQVEFTIP